MPKAKVKKSAKKATLGSKKTYVVVGDADRVFTEAEHGFDLKLLKGDNVEVSAKVAGLVKKNYPYLEVR